MFQDQKVHPRVAAARSCRICEAELPFDPHPIIRIHPEARVALISQAPGRLAHQSGVPWDDPSGKRLREWLGVTEEKFYATPTFAILPLGFCYPGKGRGGDLPPRPECAPQWHRQLLELMPKIELKILIGAWAQRYYLGNRAGKNLTATVLRYSDYLPAFFPIPHPSPRNRIFLRKNPEIEQVVIPRLRQIVTQFLDS